MDHERERVAKKKDFGISKTIFMIPFVSKKIMMLGLAEEFGPVQFAILG